MEKALEWRQSTSRDGTVGRGRKKAARRGLWPPGILTRGIILSGAQVIQSHTSSATAAPRAVYFCFLILFQLSIIHFPLPTFNSPIPH
jgi:hypothetical protein